MHADTTNRITPEENWRLFCRDLRIKLPEKREADWAFRIKISRAEYDRRAKAGLLKPGMSYLIDEEPQPAFSRFKGWLRHRSLDRQIRAAEDNREHARVMLDMAQERCVRAGDAYDKAHDEVMRLRDLAAG